MCNFHNFLFHLGWKDVHAYTKGNEFNRNRTEYAAKKEDRVCLCSVGHSAMSDRITEVREAQYEGDYSNRPPSPTENLSSASDELVISRPRPPPTT